MSLRIVRSRLPASLLLLLLCGCAQTWESHPPSAPPGGTGLTQQGEVVEGADAVSSITKAPARNATGTVEPFGTQGKAAAYEYSQGYRIGAGDKLSIRVAGEADLTGDYTVDASGMISMPY